MAEPDADDLEEDAAIAEPDSRPGDWVSVALPDEGEEGEALTTEALAAELGEPEADELAAGKAAAAESIPASVPER